jgi:hypothetical protein
MTDTHHDWNDGKPIRAKQHCGCHITAKTFKLCWIGKDYKKGVDEAYNLYMKEKERAIDTMIKRAHRVVFEVQKKAYLRHLETGQRA